MAKRETTAVSLKREIREHDAKCRKIISQYRLGCFYLQYKAYTRNDDIGSKMEAVGNMMTELMDLGLAEFRNAKLFLLDPNTNEWFKPHHAEWGIVNHTKKVLDREVNKVLSLERAKRLFSKKSKFKSEYEDDL